jgi:hypothetical protein
MLATRHWASAEVWQQQKQQQQQQQWQGYRMAEQPRERINSSMAQQGCR